MKRILLFVSLFAFVIGAMAQDINFTIVDGIVFS